MTLSGPGSLEVRLDGTEGDWDVAVFDAAGSVLAADASPDAQEVASGFALKGGTVHVQACRRSGDAASVPATLEHSAIAPGAAEAREGRPAAAGRRDHPDPRAEAAPASTSGST